MTIPPPPGAPPGAQPGGIQPGGARAGGPRPGGPLFATQPQALAPSQPSRSRVPPPPRRHRGIFWVAVLTSLVALVGGTFVAVTTYVSASAPDAIATDYFHALGRGDAAAALALGDVPVGPRTYLTDGALRAALRVAGISDVKVLSVDRGGDTADVSVQYQLNFRPRPITVTDTVALRRHASSWRLVKTAVPVHVATGDARHRLTLAGARFPSARAVLVFPGALPASVDTPNLEIDTTNLKVAAMVVHLDGTTPSSLRPVISPAGTKAARAAVASAIRTCLGTRPSPSCPVPTDARVVPGTVHGALSGEQELSVQVAHSPDGMLDIRGTVTVRGPYQQLDFDNLPVAKSGTIALEIRAHCYATNPSKLVWGPA